jgi:hypothetical protein
MSPTIFMMNGLHTSYEAEKDCSPEPFDEQMCNMIMDIGKNLMYRKHKFVGDLT